MRQNAVRPILLILVSIPVLLAQTPTANSIMAEVAKHQDQADELRAKYTYSQKVRVRAIRSDGKLSREEYTVYNVIPSVNGTKKHLVKFAGRYMDKGRVVEYKKSGEEIPGRKIDIDSGLVPNLHDHLVNDKKSRDGLGKHLFPLTTAEFKKYGGFRIQAHLHDLA